MHSGPYIAAPCFSFDWAIQIIMMGEIQVLGLDDGNVHLYLNDSIKCYVVDSK